jgi:hypothetical protein
MSSLNIFDVSAPLGDLISLWSLPKRISIKIDRLTHGGGSRLPIKPLTSRQMVSSQESNFLSIQSDKRESFFKICAPDGLLFCESRLFVEG